MAVLPSDVAKTCVERSRRLLTLADHEDLPDTKIRQDLRRYAIVMAVVAIDAYLHWLIHHRIGAVRQKGLPKAFAKLTLPFPDLASMADNFIEAQQQQPRKDVRPWVQVKNSLQRRLLKETYQSSEQVGNALALAGIEKAWSKIAAKLGIGAEQAKAQLDQLVMRRNQIVHEGDIARSPRPHKLTANPIDKAAVAASVDWIESLIAAIEQVVIDEA